MKRRTFVFDAHAGRAIVVDGDGEEALGLDRLDGLLDHLAGRGDTEALRAFLFACIDRLPAYRATEHLPALRAATERGDAEALAAFRAEHTHVAMAAGVVGLRHGAPNAAAFLALFAATHPNVRRGAGVAAQMERLHAELCAEDPAQLTPEAVTQTQIDWLLDHLSAS